mmetsp:Transcript_24531/g.21775  ORF Transcript_24531/g.21775 Transcript_24531/m.21775 type:complete len:176 (+) Transcript_24531:78-605(+)
MFISQIMKTNSIYFVSDISDKMIEIFKTRFEESEFEAKTFLKEIENPANLEEEIQKLDKYNKKIFILNANNELLPYPDSYFDCYISSLSLMMVSSHQNQLSEAYRVLEEGGTAGFTVWGRPENTSFYTFIPEIFEEAEVPLKKYKNSFHLSDKDFLVNEAKKIGFKSVKAFYTMT